MDDIKLVNKSQDSYLKKQIQEGEFASFMLFVGQEGMGKKDSAYSFAGAVLCDNKNGEPCGLCDNCNLMNVGNHPDLLMFGGEGVIKIAEIRQLQKSLYLKPYRAHHKVAIINDAHLMTDESANALLKVLEEPPKNSVIILTSLDKTLLPKTVVSRSQVVNFGASDVFDRDIDNEILKDMSKLMDGKGSVSEKFSITHKYAKEKETAVDLLNSLETVLRKDLLENNSSEEENINKLEKIQESRKYLQRNMSGKFVLENLIINLLTYELN